MKPPKLRLPNRFNIDLFVHNADAKKATASLLGRDEPAVWHVAAAALPPIEAAAAAAAAPLSETEIEAKRQTAEGALENEARVFQNDLGACLCVSALKYCRLSSTTSSRTTLVRTCFVSALKYCRLRV